MNRLTDKTALIFGADPITIGIATRFLLEGAAVTIIDEADALATCPVGVTTAILADREPETARSTVAGALGGGQLDILVIAGGDIPEEAEWKPVSKISVDELLAGQKDDTARALAVAQAAEAALRAQGGSVIFLFSAAGLYSEGGWGERPIAHHAKRGLARALAMQWGPDQIRVNTLVPLAATAGMDAYRRRNPQAVDFRVSKVAMGRLGDPVKDIGGAAVFLASEDTTWLTGSMIFADGGNFLTTPVVETRLDPAT